MLAVRTIALLSLAFAVACLFEVLRGGNAVFGIGLGVMLVGVVYLVLGLGNGMPTGEGWARRAGSPFKDQPSLTGNWAAALVLAGIAATVIGLLAQIFHARF